MSKAFTNEDALPAPSWERPPIRLEPGEKRYVTREGFARLSSEREHLQQARSQATAPSPEMDARLASLEALLSMLTVVEPQPDTDQVYFGAWVELADEGGARVHWRLVGPDEVDASQGLISVHSPVGRALLGKSVGDTVVVERPRGAREFEVKGIGRSRT